MQDDTNMINPEAGADVTNDSPLPDIPDAGADSQPLVPPEPIDISTNTITADASLVAGTFGDPRTMYEQALDAYEASEGGVPSGAQPDPAALNTNVPTSSTRRARIYDRPTS